MSIYFNPDEIFEMAEQIERNGAKFYRQAAGQAMTQQLSQRLLGLAAMEEGHEKVFALMRKEAEKSGSDSEFKADDQTTAYLRAWADGHVFNVREDPSQKIFGKETLTDILQIAIGLEKDSIVFYLGLKGAIPKRKDQESVEKIINEEMGHIATLSTELATLKHQSL